MASNRIIVGLGIKLDNNSLRMASAALQGFRAKMLAAGQRLQRFGAGAQQIGQNMATRITAPILVAGGVVAKVAGDFEQSMNVLEAKTGASAEQLAALRERAKELGATTQFTAAAAANGMIEFAKAGFSAEKILASITPALDFAVAAQMELADVTALTANTLAQFGLKADSSVMVADLLTKGSDSATTNVQELGEALVMAGSGAGAAGVSLKETVSILAAMANTGIKGSMAGTALANSFAYLAKPPPQAKKTLKRLGIDLADFIDKTGQVKRPFSEFIGALSKAGAGTSDLIDIFEMRAARSFIGIVKNYDKVTEAVKAMDQADGNAAKQAAVMMKGFNGAVKTLISALEALAIAVANSGFLEWLTDVVTGLAMFFRELANLNPRLLRTITIIAGMAALVGPILMGIGLLSKAFGALAVSALGGWLAVTGPALLAAGIVGFIYLLVDDMIAFLEGRPSVIGYLIGDPDGIWPAFEKSFRDFMAFIESDGTDIAKEFWDAWVGAAKIFNDSLVTTRELLRPITNLLTGSTGWLEKFSGLFGPTPEQRLRNSQRQQEIAMIANGRNTIDQVARGRPGNSQQIVAPNITVTITKPGSTSDDIISALRRETAAIFGDLARQVQPPLVQ